MPSILSWNTETGGSRSWSQCPEELPGGAGRTLAGKVVIDTNNYYPQRDGQIPELDNESTTTAELLQEASSHVESGQAFNHIDAAELTTHGQPAGSTKRRALAIAGDDQAARDTVTSLLDQFGFDTVDAGPLKEGWRIQRDTPGYGPRRTADDLRQDLPPPDATLNCSRSDVRAFGRSDARTFGRSGGLAAP